MWLLGRHLGLGKFTTLTTRALFFMFHGTERKEPSTPKGSDS